MTTHVGQVLQDMIQQLGLYVMPTLSGGTLHYGQLHEDPPSSYYQDFPTDPKLDNFRHDPVDGWLPPTYLDIKTYLNQATLALMGANKVRYIWILKASPSKPRTHYAIGLWSEGTYDLGESLALFMGFLELDPNRPGQTCIVSHNNQWTGTGDNTRAWYVVRRLDKQHVGISEQDCQVGGIRLYLDVHPE